MTKKTSYSTYCIPGNVGSFDGATPLIAPNTLNSTFATLLRIILCCSYLQHLHTLLNMAEMKPSGLRDVSRSQNSSKERDVSQFLALTLYIRNFERSYNEKHFARLYSIKTWTLGIHHEHVALCAV